MQKPFGYLPKILLLNENARSQNSIFTSSLFLRVVAGVIKKRLTIGQPGKTCLPCGMQRNTLAETLKNGGVVLDFFPPVSYPD